MEKWIVLQWHHYSSEPAAVVFKGSESECREAATEILKRLPKNMDCYAMAENEYKQRIGMFN